MRLFSKFDKGNVIDIFEKGSKTYRIMVVDEIVEWSRTTGFKYRLYELCDYKIYETYDELEFSQDIDIEAVYKDLDEYKKMTGRE